MSATKALTANLTLTQNVTQSALEALKAGMTAEEVVATLNKIVELIENSDGE